MYKSIDMDGLGELLKKAHLNFRREDNEYKGQGGRGLFGTPFSIYCEDNHIHVETIMKRSRFRLREDGNNIEFTNALIEHRII